MVFCKKLFSPNGAELWKYVDDATTSETVNRNHNSNMQTAVDTLVNCTTADKFQFKKEKCKELRIYFATKNIPTFDPIIINNKPIDIVTDAKILGLKVSRNLKWNDHIESVAKKASKRLFSFSKLKRSGLGITELIYVYRT